MSIPKPSVGQPSEFTASPSAVRIFVLSLVEHAPGRERDPVDAAHDVEQRRVDRRRRRLLALDRDVEALAGDDGVGPGVRVDEERR